MVRWHAESSCWLVICSHTAPKTHTWLSDSHMVFRFTPGSKSRTHVETHTTPTRDHPLLLYRLICAKTITCTRKMFHATNATALAKAIILITLASRKSECGTALREPMSKPKMKTPSHPQKKSARTKKRHKVSRQPPLYLANYSLTPPLEKSTDSVKVILARFS